ncbi:hypothetical protein BX070DRAFT_226999 [Coemansia spiralis]|nr:hypothetical protein BX070DRAFT_226999 [Coemansia spiralis]
MLLLVGSERALGILWWLRPGSSLVVGRKNTSLLIEGDHSVSRKHATIFIDVQNLSAVDIRDEGSKFGIHINGKPCPSNAISRLRAGDRVTFGAQGSTFELRNLRVAFCLAKIQLDTSTTSEQFTARAIEMGIDIVDSIDKCTHLITPTITVTSKLVSALVLGCQIVSPKYLDLIDALPYTLNHSIQRPEAVDLFLSRFEFLPETTLPIIPPDIPIDLSTVDWHPDPKRKQLFRSKLCLFSTAAQYERYSLMISASGGSSEILTGAQEWAQMNDKSTNSFNIETASAANDVSAMHERMQRKSAVDGETVNICLVLPPSTYTKDAADVLDVVDFIKETARLLGVRAISESEIGLAVLFVSNEVHTNSALENKALLADSGYDPSPRQHGTKAAGMVATAEKSIPSGLPTESDENSLEKGPKERRKGARFSNFWSAMISNDVSSEKQGTQKGSSKPSISDKVVSDPLFHTASTGQPDKHIVAGRWGTGMRLEAKSTRRKIQIDNFWAASVTRETTYSQAYVSNNEEKEKEKGSEAGAVTYLRDGEVQGVQVIESPEAEQTLESPAVIMMPLVKTKNRASIPQTISDSHPKPNYKRFRKTVHLYQ